MPDTTPRPPTNSNSSPARSPRPAPSGMTARPAGGPNGNGGRPAPRPGAPRPGGAGGRPGAPAGGRPGGRPGGGPRGGHRGNGRRGGPTQTAPRPERKEVRPSGPVTIPAQIVVKDLAELLSVSVNEVIRNLIASGVYASINEVISYDISAKVAEAIGYTPDQAVTTTPAVVASRAQAAAAAAAAARIASADTNRVTRPPVVTVMGHVDHGKTSLLDAIRNTRVAAGEAGGITQHIGAYQVEVGGRKITFLDTPGHEAFTAMRARGAQVTDIAIIVVAADDGVMPQTIEAIDHARAAQVPIIIALNKIDKPGANPDHVKQQLADRDVVIEEYGGDVICVPVSAKKNIGLQDLLEMILLVADILDLKANPRGPAQGAIIEARMAANSGVTATALVHEGTLKVGDIIVAGALYGKVRAMFDDAGKRIPKAPPSLPVSLLGLSEVPDAGDRFEVVADEKTARTLTQQRRDQAQLAAQQSITLDTLYAQMREGKVKELNLLVKSDVQGSAEALKHSLSQIGDENLKVRLIHDAVGNVSESDVNLASASSAIIIAFNVKVDAAAQRLAQIEGVDIRSYTVIYKLVEDIEAALQGLLEPVFKEQVDGHAEVIQIFKAGRTLVIGGCRVTDGKLLRSAQTRVLRKGEVVYTGEIQSLRRGKDDVREVNTGFECGVTLEDFNALEIGDIVETYSKVRA
ncbi:MAG TPA: translation initiation factor IF-2 [Ktedonobacterales bacterium]|nr:translation initiation factor IF-2 [Ktedonobacterales bacterium]